jgi:uncharacterized protein (TIGR02266 family)
MAIVSLSVRLKAVTVDEFIDHHAVNVSAQGIFVQTERPSLLDTLVQLQVRLATGQTIIAGLGRVVWTRDASQATVGPAAGMGVKFVKLDERSRAFVGNLVIATEEAGRAYEEEAEQSSAAADEPPLAAQRIAARRTTPRPSALASTDASLLNRIPFLRKPNLEASAPRPGSSPSSRPPERPPSSIPAPTSPTRSTGRPVPRDPRS